MAESTKEQKTISFQVTSDGFVIKPILKLKRVIASKTIVALLQQKNIEASVPVIQLIRKVGFSSTTGIIYKVVIIHGNSIESRSLTEEGVRGEAKRRGLSTPPYEIGYLLAKYLHPQTLRDLGLKTLIVMHQPIKDKNDDESLYGIDCMERTVSLCLGGSDKGNKYFPNDGFVFIETNT